MAGCSSQRALGHNQIFERDDISLSVSGFPLFAIFFASLNPAICVEIRRSRMDLPSWMLFFEQNFYAMRKEITNEEFKRLANS
jgi:hypothetical protein